MRPGDEAELVAALRGATGPLRIVGGGTRHLGLGGTAALAGAEGVLETAGMAGVSLYEPEALTLVARAGTSLAAVAAMLAGERQRLAFEVPDLRGLLGRQGTSTLGGVVAANASGPRRIQVGACRDSLLGVRFVDGAGAVIKNGGRVMKNVTGYDLVKLMAGSHGTLGVLCEVSFKVQAEPEAEATLVWQGLTAELAVMALSTALGSPFDVSGAAHVAGLGQTMIRLEGMAGSVAYRSRALNAALGGGWAVVTDAASAQMWRCVRDVAALAGRPGAVWRVSVKPAAGPQVVAAMGARVRDAVYDWGGGLVWLLCDEVAGADADAGASELRRLVRGFGGHATLMRASDAVRQRVPVFHPEAAGVAALSRGLRAKFDPRGILNPGMMG